MENNKTNKKKITWIIIVVIIVLVTNLATYLVCTYMPVFLGKSIIIKADDTTAAAAVNKMLYISQKLDDNYLWKTDKEAMWDSAIKGLLAGTGDDYAAYYTKDEYKSYQEIANGKYSGIGVQITNNDSGDVKITKVFANTPAIEAGIQVGDIITMANDTSLIGMNIEKAVTYIRGTKGTSVSIKVNRSGSELSFDVVRQDIELVYVESKMLADNVGYVYISEFETNTYNQFASAVKSLSEQNMTGLILDLRQNPGGSVSEAVNIADDLLNQTDIMYTIDHDGNKQVYSSNANCIQVPVVVLIDQYSASSAEILTIALKDNNAALIVGQKSYGKGIMQKLIPLSDGTMYKYTFAEYFGPKGTEIHKVGITPDYEIALPEEYQNKLIGDIPYESDTQLQKAVEVVKTMNK